MCHPVYDADFQVHIITNFKIKCMKTMKFLFFAFLLMFVFSNAYSQKNNTKECITLQSTGVDFPCISELESYLFDFEVCTTTFESGKVQVRIKGTLTGQDTGDIYTVSGVENFNTQNGPSIATLVINVSIVDKAGMVVGVMQQFGHITTNANGVVTVDKFETTIECAN